MPLITPTVLCFSCFMISVSEVDVPAFQKIVFSGVGYFFSGALLYNVYFLIHKNFLNVFILVVFLIGCSTAAYILSLEATFLVIAGCSIVALLASFETILPNAAFRIKPLGDMSYSLYLVHVPIQATILLFADLALDGSRAFAESWMLLPSFIFVSILVSHIVHFKFERPAGRYLRRHLGRFRTTPAA